MRYLIKLAYNGTSFNGWQKQHNAIGVQTVLEEKLSLLLGKNTETLGCGRTDTGVHAKAFFVHFDSDVALDEKYITYKLNHLLPKQMVVFEVYKVADDFNARFDAISRTYEYWITTRNNPFLQDQAWYLYGNLDMVSMNEAAKLLIGKKDFECFSKVHTQVNNYVCTITEAYWKYDGDLLIFTITANRFLRNMVRAIVGTLVEVGKNKMTVADVEKILASKNRSEAGQSVTAKGLYLTKVVYPEGAF